MLNQKRYTISDKEWKNIWFVDVGIDPNHTQISIWDIKINENERNKWYGKMIYKELVRLSKLPLVSYISSPEADRVRESLKKEWLVSIDKNWFRTLEVEKVEKQII